MNLPSRPATIDEQLMLRVQADEPERFGELAARYRTGLVRTATSRLGSRHLAEDAVQETLLAAFKSRHTFDPRFTFRTWLWTILLNQCRAIWSRRQKTVIDGASHLSVSAPLVSANLAADVQPPEYRMLSQERSQRLAELLYSLSPAQADALRLRFFGEMKFQEIADTMGCSLATAKNRVRWGLERIAQSLAGEDESDWTSRERGASR